MPETKQTPGVAEPWHFLALSTLASTAIPVAGELAAVFHAMEEGVCVLDATGRILFANPAGAAMMGFSSPEALMASPPEQVARKYSLLDASGTPIPLEQMPGVRALRGERLPPEKLRFRVLETGEERWVRCSATPFFDEDGKVRRVVLFIRDITAQRRAEQEHRFLARASALLTESLDPGDTLHALVRLAVPELADWCLLDLVDEDGSPKLVAVAHLDPRREEQAREMRRRYPPRHDSPVTRVMLTGEPVLIEEMPPQQVAQGAVDASHLDILRAVGLRSVMAVPLRARGRVLGVITLVVSETARRFGPEDLPLATELAHRAAVALQNARLFQRMQLAEAKSREGADRLRLALEAGRLGTWEWNVMSGTLTWSTEMERMHGVELGAFEGTVKAYQRVVCVEDWPRLEGAYRKLKESETRSEFRQLYRVFLPDGALRWIETQGMMVRDLAGRPLRLLGVCADVTEREEAARARAAHEMELARSNSELQQFAYVASHDLQEPLRMVASYTQLLARRYRGRLDSDADEYIGFAIDGANRMQRLIRDLLEYSRVGSRAKTFERISFHQVLERATGNLHEAIRECGAEITCDPLPEVRGDSVQLEQLVQNLVGNALKFRSPGTAPRVHVSAARRGDEWIFSVRDNGIGIEP
ncbi:MAG TPA: PAS domain S-box protein, partial [Longimicrobium sp.]|nr:PAS domain S-box protein [Longimicrobium sp.]